MSEFVPAFVVILVGFVLAAVQAASFSRRESPLLLLGFAAHVVSAFVQVWFTRVMYGWGDLFGYSSLGESFSAYLRSDFPEFAPEMVKVLFHQIPNLPFDVPAAGSSTGAMIAIATFIAFFTGGSFYTLGLVVAVFGYFGKVALYRGFRGAFPDSLRVRLLIAITLIPSSIFWSSALLKEAVAIGGLGYLVLGIISLRSKIGVVPLFQAFGGAVVVGMVKAYILFPVMLATVMWLYVSSTRRGKTLLRPLPLALAGVAAMGGVTLLGKIFPQFAVENLGEWAAYYQEIGPTVSGGSTYAFGDPTQATLSGQLAFAPLALVTALFRPFLFEARSAQVAVNGLETAVLLVWWIRVLVRAGAGGVFKKTLQYPLLVFSLTFTLTFAVAVGLTTTNLGTLSRYRMPLVPFFWALLLALDALTTSTKAQARSASVSIRRQRAALAAQPLRRPTAHQ